MVFIGVIPLITLDKFYDDPHDFARISSNIYNNCMEVYDGVYDVLTGASCIGNRSVSSSVWNFNSN